MHTVYATLTPLELLAEADKLGVAVFTADDGDIFAWGADGVLNEPFRMALYRHRRKIAALQRQP